MDLRAKYKSMLLCKCNWFFIILLPYAWGSYNSILTFLFTTASLQIMPGCKLQLLQAETTWLVAMKGFTHPIIAVTVFMDIGFCFYTQLNSQLVVKLKPCIPQTATHPASAHPYKTKHTPGHRFEYDSKHKKIQVFFLIQLSFPANVSLLFCHHFFFLHYFSLMATCHSAHFLLPPILLGYSISCLYLLLYGFKWQRNTIAEKSGDGLMKDRMMQ